MKLFITKSVQTMKKIRNAFISKNFEISKVRFKNI